MGVVLDLSQVPLLKTALIHTEGFFALLWPCPGRLKTEHRPQRFQGHTWVVQTQENRNEDKEVSGRNKEEELWGGTYWSWHCLVIVSLIAQSHRIVFLGPWTAGSQEKAWWMRSYPLVPVFHWSKLHAYPTGLNASLATSIYQNGRQGVQSMDTKKSLSSSAHMQLAQTLPPVLGFSLR